MKKIISFAVGLSVLLSFGSCGHYGGEIALVQTEESSEQTETSEPESSEEATKSPEPYFQVCHKTIKNSEKPEVVSIIFEGICADNIKKHASVEDLYNVHVLHSGVVGLIGIPIELEYDDTVSKPRLTFRYNEEELRGVPEKNLIMLHYSEEDYFYNTMEDAVIDTDANTVSASIDEPGVYLLADAYEWLGVWGFDVDDYAYDRDPAEYESDWERECYTGDILKLADKDYAMSCDGVFHVDSPETLASAVWYVNSVSGNVQIYLDADIDLTGYEWVPMGWSKASGIAFSGTVDGQNHTIKGMTIHEDYVQSGFIGYGLGVTVKNIKFEDAYVSATHCAGIVGGEIYSSPLWENVRVSGTVKGGKDDYGAIIGREAGTTFKNCSSDAVVNGEKTEYFSYRQKVVGETEVVETFTLTVDDDHVLTRDDHEGFQNLGWHIERDGVRLLDRSAVDFHTKEPELTLDTHEWVGSAPGTYTIYLTAYINGAYIRVSNIIEYEL